MQVVYLRVCVALQKLESPSFRALVDADAVAPHHGKYLRLPGAEVVDKLGPKQWLPVVLLRTATAIYISNL